MFFVVSIHSIFIGVQGLHDGFIGLNKTVSVHCSWLVQKINDLFQRLTHFSSHCSPRQRDVTLPPIVAGAMPWLLDCVRLVATAELWPACDHCRRYLTLIRYLAKRPLYASNRKFVGLQRARQPERQLS